MSAVLVEPIPNPGRPGGALDRAVLILDDCEVDRMKMRRLIEAAELPFDLVEAETLEAMEQALNARDFDLVLIDFYLVGSTGFEALELLGKMAGQRPVPIMVTGDEQTEIAVQAMKMGCADYLSKERLSPDRLKAALAEARTGRVPVASPQPGSKPPDHVTGRLVSRVSNTVRPELTRILRELREMKSDLACAQDAPPHQTEDVEQRYGELWGQLRDPATYRPNPH